MASEDWRTSGHAPDTPEAPGPHGATPEAAAAATKAAREAEAAQQANNNQTNMPGGDADPERDAARESGRESGRTTERIDEDDRMGAGATERDPVSERARREEFKREARARAEAARIEAQRQASTWWRDFTRAAVFLTRIPLQIAPDNAMRPLASAVRGFPIVGLVVGVIGAVAFLIAEELGLPHLASALIAVAATALVAGGIHEDGLADTVDGFMGARDRDRSLEIMRDSRIGAFGALALIIVLGCKVSAIETLEPAAGAAALVAAEIASRTVLPGILLWLDPARVEGLSFEAGKPAREDVLVEALLGGALVLLMIGLTAGIAAIVVAFLVAAVVGRIAQAKVGGHTGDVLGAVQQAASTAVLLAAAAAM